MFELLRRKSVVVSIILFGAAAGGGLGVYVRDNWDIEAREARVAELEKQVQEKQAVVNRLRESVEGKK
ncbi:hypothetical protein ACROYT_G008495 [Oculina patagonica]